jgi:cytochrome c oxidase assembly protein subunit 15
MKRTARALGVVATIGMFIVLIMGSTVTSTGSEHGCGRSWPLCHGQLIPQMAVSTAIEFSHRAVVGVESVLILAFAALALFVYRRRDVQILALLMVAFLFLQAGLGAWAVMAPQLTAVLALHFGVSLIAFASVLLTTVVLFEAEGAEGLRQVPIPRSYRAFVLGLAAFSYVVVYLGAYVRHTNADEACRGWPLCNGQVVPQLSGLVLNIFLHRLAALLLIAGILALLWWSSRLRATRPDLFRASVLAVVLVLLQALSGAIVVATDVDLFSALLHAALIGLLFSDLMYLCVHLLPLQRRRPAADQAAVPAGSRPAAVASAGHEA